MRAFCRAKSFRMSQPLLLRGWRFNAQSGAERTRLKGIAGQVYSGFFQCKTATLPRTMPEALKYVLDKH
jgi:hypothetical protein